MTPEQINEAVARKLGWTNSDYPVKGWLKRFYKGPEGEKEYYLDEPEDYCRSIEAAWEIIGSLKCDWEMKTTSYGIDFTIFDDAGEFPSAVEDTVPMAICMAYLRMETK